MFKQRLLTTLVLVPLVIFVLFYGNLPLMSLLIFLLVCIGGWEWCQLVPIRQNFKKAVFLVGLLTMLLVSWYFFDLALLIGLALWLLMMVGVLTYPSSLVFWGNPLFVSMLCFSFLPLFAGSFLEIYQWPHGRPMLLYLLCLVWATDTGAYLGGKWIGHTKLIPKVSPGKTIEGTCFGLVSVVLVAFIGSFYFKPQVGLFWYVLAICTALISMVGDLFVSMLKRRCQLKDTGRIIPGHGGVLDRIDSLMAAAPMFYFCTSLGLAG